MKRKSNRIYYYLGALALVLVLAAVVMAYTNHRQTATVVTPQVSGTAEPSPGQSGNPGDQAKSQTSSTPTPQSSATPVSTPAASTIAITDFTVAPRSGGQIHVASQISGTTSGTCTLGLTSPTGSARSVSGTVTYSGTYYLCSFDTISGVTETGTWKASLVVKNADKSSNVAQTTFSE
jgi:cytoskeletal protein RodZ